MLMEEKALRVLLVEDNAGARWQRKVFSTERRGSFELTHLLRMILTSAYLTSLIG